MSRFIAIALLVILNCDATLSALLAGPGSNLPACCRRDGKHHCAMLEMLEKQENAGPSWKTVTTKCPLFPRGTVAFFTDQFTPPRADGFAGLLSSRSVVKAQTEVLFHISHSRTRQKRGPPSLV